MLTHLGIKVLRGPSAYAPGDEERNKFQTLANKWNEERMIFREKVRMTKLRMDGIISDER